jgi:formate-dependent nitrite reductase membrane component NrfD
MEPGLLQSAHWPLLIDVYFFLGGLSGGAFVIATVAYLLDGARYRDIVRVGYYVAFLAILPCPILLIVDLGIPARFLHMLMVSKPTTDIGTAALTVGPFHLKPLSPMNAGAWALLGYSVCAFVAALDVFLEDRGGRSVGSVRVVAGLLGGVLGYFVAAYPGVLLGSTARPLFIGSHWLGVLFIAVGASTGAAAVALILSLMGGRRGEHLARLMRFTAYALVLQAIALIMLVVMVRGAGSQAMTAALGGLLSGPYSLTFWLGAVVVGLAIPLAIQFAGAIRRATPGVAALVALLVLIGGFVVKYVVIAAGQAT